MRALTLTTFLATMIAASSVHAQEDLLAPVPAPLPILQLNPDEQSTRSVDGATLNSLSYDLWQTGAGPLDVSLNLDGWSSSVGHDPMCMPGFAGCQSGIGGRLGLDAAIALSDGLELRLGLGASASNGGVGADGRVSVIWWFSRNVGLALAVGVYQPFGVGAAATNSGNETVDAMHEHQRNFDRHTPFESPNGASTAPQWFGGASVVTR